MDYFAVPFAVTHLAQFVSYVDAEMGEGIVGGTGDEKLVLTTARDTARFVVGACGLPRGSWPKFGGMVGERTSLNEIIAVVEKLKGRKFKIHRHTIQEIEKGDFTWFPMIRHPSVPVDETLSKRVCQEGLLGFARGDYDVSGDFNALLPSIKPQSLEEYLRECWKL